MTDEEFATRLEIRLRKHLPMDDHHREKLWEIIADIRGMEREEISRQKMLEERKDIHPVCHH
jgi:hypothetical protein